ncbi:hypothetical protein Bca52824_044107 [Brassica carinata]|uniref:Uncharacterized protein n=1 Tax=Brassica carinata TaxID=52824 RepID=A0A8X7S1C0_BRACI|nr:hypothetical protein Bca52824_044107 [Brassica carinata]
MESESLQLTAESRRRRRTVTTTRIIPPAPLGGFDGGVSPATDAAATSDDKDEEDENVASLASMEDDLKTGVDDCNGVGEGEVRIEVLDEEISGGGSRGHRRSTSSMASSSLKRMLSSRSRPECSKVFPSATQDSSP